MIGCEEDGVVGGETEMLRKVWWVCTVPCLLLRGEETMWHCVESDGCGWE
jgi:hypothetical protein